MIPDQGTLTETAPVKLLLSLYEQDQTGILYFRQNEVLKVFYLNRGRISWAISADEADRVDHVLLAKKLVDPNALAPYQAGNKISETFGKILVENGVITLEVLIQATREQARLIALSVLRWSTGNYQLVQEPPPNRMMSLDLEIPAIVIQYVLGQMDVNIVWEELGSMSGELQMNPDPAKTSRYPLDAEMQGVLSRFSRPQRLESVLLDYPAEGKYRILKILYFFLLSGLLAKKEAEKPSGIDFRELDNMFGQPADNAPAEVDIEMPAMIDETAIQDIPLAAMPEAEPQKEAAAEKELPTFPDLLPPGTAEAAEEEKEVPRAKPEPRPRPHPAPFQRPEKTKSRRPSMLLLTVLLVAAIAGAFLWFTRSKEPPAPGTAKPAAARKAPPAARPRKQAPAPGAAGTAVAGQKEPTAGGTSAPGTLPAAGQKPVAGPMSTEPRPGASAVTPVKAPATTPVKPPAAPSLEKEAEAGRRFAAGNFRAAGDIWRGIMLEADVKFSILLEMDCLKASVRTAYGQLSDKEGFFLLNKTSRDGRSCWLVLWGRYRTAAEAALGMALVPEYFKRQSDPPSVLELAPYL